MSNSGTSDLASSLGSSGLVKQENFIKIETTKPVKCLKNWNMIGIVIFTCPLFWSYSFWTHALIYVIFPCLKPGFLPCWKYKLMVPDLTTRDCEHFMVPIMSQTLHNAWLSTDSTLTIVKGHHTYLAQNNSSKQCGTFFSYYIFLCKSKPNLSGVQGGWMLSLCTPS